MTMHTPGPWRITGPNIRSDNHTDGTGALLFVQQRPFNDSEPDPDEQAANLKLVAAAPKLQAILEGFLGTLDAPDNSHTHHYFNENIALFTLAIETIKELRGETEVETVTIDADGETVTIEYKDGLPHLVPISEEWWDIGCPKDCDCLGFGHNNLEITTEEE